MPYADNLYSADDSDTESFSDELSPTDGYFMRRDHPQEVMVQDPSLEASQSTSQWKADEANSASSHSHGATSSQLPSSSPLPILTPLTSMSPTANTMRSPTPPRSQPENLYSETSSLLYHTVPPPAYSMTVCQARIQPSVQNLDVLNYSTIPAHQLEHQPESMSQPVAFNERFPLWLKKFRKVPRRQQCRNLLLTALVLSLAVGFLTAAVKSIENVSSYFCTALVSLLLIKNYVVFDD
jgi:hypothetical protein